MSDKRLGSSSGLTLVTDAGTAFVSSEFNSGHMVGDIKLAALSDTTAETIGTAVTELVTNGDGNSATGWNGARGIETVSSTGGRVRATSTSTGAYGVVQTLSGLTVGARYRVQGSIYVAGGTGIHYFRVGESSDLSATFRLNEGSSSDEVYDQVFQATASTMYIGSIHVSTVAGDYTEIDNISVTPTTELVENGTFDAGTTGWSLDPASVGSISVINGQLSHSVTSGSFWQAQFVDVVPNKTYVLEFDFISKTGGNAFFRVGNGSSHDNTSYVNVQNPATGGLAYTFTPTVSTINVSTGTEPVQTTVWDNISVRPAVEDRSVNNNGLQVHGQLTKTAVATGSDLVAWSGFSANNYLEQPYNSDLDFGTGDFCVMGWVKGKSAAYNCFLNRTVSTTAINGLRIMDSGSDTILVNGYGSNLSGGAYPLTSWFKLCFVRTGGVGYIYINGSLATSGAWASSVTDSGASTYFGGYWTGGVFALNSPSLALWRISATAPTAEMVAQIYEDEKVLFQDGAQATLYGTSDAVTALAYDDDKNLLHVGTSAGRSDFKGLRRVNNTTTAVTTAISASNAMIVEQ